MLCKICKNITLTGACCKSKIEGLTFELNQNILKNIKINIKEESANTQDLQCPKCGSKEIQIKTFQNRSADESVTTRIHCLNCDYKDSGDSIGVTL